MPGFDWNGNGKRDNFDRFMDMKVMSKVSEGTEDTKNIQGSVLCEHIRSIDYEIRNLKFVEKLSDNDFISIITLLNACIEE